MATHEGHVALLGLAPCKRSFSVVPPKVQLADACAIYFVEVAHTMQHSNVTLLHAHSRGQLHSLFVLVLRWARKRVSSHMGKIETMDVLPTMAFTRNGITQACNTILDLSSVDGTRNGSPEFVLIPYVFYFKMKGLRDPFTTVGWKRLFATLVTRPNATALFSRTLTRTGIHKVLLETKRVFRVTVSLISNIQNVPDAVASRPAAFQLFTGFTTHDAPLFCWFMLSK